MPQWRVLSVRFTLFVTPDFEISSNLWRDLTGDEPESSSFQRSSAIKTEAGPLLDGTLRLQVQPMRIDLFYEPTLDQSQLLPTDIGPFPQASEQFLQLLDTWSDNAGFPGISRIALGFVLATPTENRETGYRELRAFIPGVPDAAEATDFLYQINWPRPATAGIEGLKLNRLSRWSVGAFTALSINLVTTNQTSQTVTAPLRYRVILELDVNTSAEFSQIIPRESFSAVAKDLLTGAEEISQGKHVVD